MSPAPSVVFDVNETLSDMAPLTDRFGEFEQLLSVEQATVWKPARAAYEYIAAALV